MKTESSLMFLEIQDFGQIRITPDGKGSVFDTIRVVTGNQNPRRTWKFLTERFPEVVSKIYNFKFPGNGQRTTPVMDKAGLFELIGLLPGAVGAKYRAGAAQLVVSLLENPAVLAQAAIERIDDKENLENVAAAAYRKYIDKYHPLMGEIKKRGGVSPVTYQHVNTVNTKTCLGKEPHIVKAERGGKTARVNATPTELTRLAVLQDLQHGGLVKRKAEGHTEITSIVNDAANKFQALLNEFGIEFGV